MQGPSTSIAFGAFFASVFELTSLYADQLRASGRNVTNWYAGVSRPFPREGYLKDWRLTVVDALRWACRRSGADAQTRATSTRLEVDCSTMSDVYEFGVYTGRVLRSLVSRLSEARPKKVPVRHFWGFDSFQGMPSMKRDIEAGDTYTASAFPEGLFNVTGLLEKATKTDPVRLVQQYINSTQVTLVSGFFDQSLTPVLPRRHAMQPALYVDVDCDVYSSTFEALRWMLDNELIRPGTFVGYDDWGWASYANATKGKARRWLGVYTIQVPLPGEVPRIGGEQRAHWELTREYGLDWKVYPTVSRSAAVFQLASRAAPPKSEAVRKIHCASDGDTPGLVTSCTWRSVPHL